MVGLNTKTVNKKPENSQGIGPSRSTKKVRFAAASGSVFSVEVANKS
jgi:hypothetical protein